MATHAFLWTRPPRNMLFYSPATDADFDTLDELGGVGDQYLSHQHEASRMLARIAGRFGSRDYTHPPQNTGSSARGKPPIQTNIRSTNFRDATRRAPQ